MKKFVSVLGSTGSIGINTLNIIRRKKNFFKPFIFSANKNYRLICKQIIEFKPIYFVIDDKETFKKISKKFKKSKTKIISDYDNIKFKPNSNVTIAAIPGLAGLKPILSLINISNKMLLANKEAIICGWNLIKKKAKKFKTKLVPVDSEHFSIYQIIKDLNKDSIEKIFLTASGGPFLNFNENQLKKIKPIHAIKHPKWKMGKKISVDSATMMNKIFEVIEAQKIFDLPAHKLDILVHPNSLVHAIVKFKNGITKFIYHDTTMLIPLANALFDNNLNIRDFLPNNKNSNQINIKNLFFEKPNKKIFPIIKVLNRVNEYPSTPIIVNAANEILVDQFIKKNVSFLTISKTIMRILNDINYKKYAINQPLNIKQIESIDHWARCITIRILNLKNE